MPGWLATLLLQYLLPAIANLIISFLKNLVSAQANDPTIIEVIGNIVQGIEGDHSDWSGEQKRSYVFDAVKQYFTRTGKEIKDSLVNTLIELSVQQLKAKSSIP
jgi:hypothetical protein